MALPVVLLPDYSGYSTQYAVGLYCATGPISLFSIAFLASFKTFTFLSACDPAIPPIDSAAFQSPCPGFRPEDSEGELEA